MCAICGLLEHETDPLSALALCDGPCMRSFHVACLGFVGRPTGRSLPLLLIAITLIMTRRRMMSILTWLPLLPALSIHIFLTFHLLLLPSFISLYPYYSNPSTLISGKTWYCNECKADAHSCFVCGLVGQDYLEVTKCQVELCGKYYHET